MVGDDVKPSGPSSPLLKATRNHFFFRQLSETVEKKAELAIEKDELEEKFVDLSNSQFELDQQLQRVQSTVDVLRSKSNSGKIQGLAELRGNECPVQVLVCLTF